MFRGRGERLILSAAPGQRFTTIGGSFEQPHTFGTDNTVLASGTYNREELPDFNLWQIQARLGLERDLSDHWRVSFGPTVEGTEMWDLSQPQYPRLQRRHRLHARLRRLGPAVVHHHARHAHRQPRRAREPVRRADVRGHALRPLRALRQPVLPGAWRGIRRARAGSERQRRRPRRQSARLRPVLLRRARLRARVRRVGHLAAVRRRADRRLLDAHRHRRSTLSRSSTSPTRCTSAARCSRTTATWRRTPGELGRIRVGSGVGLRAVLPKASGLTAGINFAWPVNSYRGDSTQVFTFFMGMGL